MAQTILSIIFSVVCVAALVVLVLYCKKELEERNATRKREEKRLNEIADNVAAMRKQILGE